MEYDDFYYPENLLRKVSFFGWSPLALAFVAVSSLLSIVLLLFFGMIIPLLLSVLSAILTFGVNDVSFYQLIKRYGKYLLTDQTEYYWDSNFEERKSKNVPVKKQKRRSGIDQH